MKSRSAGSHSMYMPPAPMQLHTPPIKVHTTPPAFVPRIPLPPATPPATQPDLPLPGPAEDSLPYDRNILWERVVETQFALRVGTIGEKAIAITAAGATAGAVAGITALATVTSHGIALAAVIALGATNAILGCIATNVAVQTFRHSRPARPGALRKHSFYLTGIVPRRSCARNVVRWLVEQNFLGENRQRQILRHVTGQDLIRRGLQEKFPALTAIDIEKIADTLVMVQAIEEMTAIAPQKPLRRS